MAVGFRGGDGSLRGGHGGGEAVDIDRAGRVGHQAIEFGGDRGELLVEPRGGRAALSRSGAVELSALCRELGERRGEFREGLLACRKRRAAAPATPLDSTPARRSARGGLARQRLRSAGEPRQRRLGVGSTAGARARRRRASWTSRAASSAMRSRARASSRSSASRAALSRASAAAASASRSRSAGRPAAAIAWAVAARPAPPARSVTSRTPLVVGVRRHHRPRAAPRPCRRWNSVASALRMLVRKIAVADRLARLALERIDLRRKLADHVLEPRQVLLGARAAAAPPRGGAHAGRKCRRPLRGRGGAARAWPG